MDFGLHGKTALVLGGGGGLGRAIAKSLASEGANVAVAGIAPNRSTRARQPWRPSASKVWVWFGTSRTWRRSTGTSQKSRMNLGPVDILVNNTGGPPPTTASRAGPGVVVETFQAMVLSVIAITDRVLPEYAGAPLGPRDNQCLLGRGVAPIPNLALSNTLRLSLVGWSKTLAREVAKDGITVNVVAARPHRHRSHKISRPGESQARRTKRGGSRCEESMASIPGGPSGQAGRIWRRCGISRQPAGCLYYGVHHPGGWWHDCEHLDGTRRNNQGNPLRRLRLQRSPPCY